jgi:arginase
MQIALIRAPSNLGLRPLRPGHEPGTWRAPEALAKAGLVEAIHPERVIDLSRPRYNSEPRSDARLLNGPAIRSFNLQLADAVETAARDDLLPIVVGGDCSVLLGALAGRRRLGPVSLVHIDGHSDFRHPGNSDPEAKALAAAGMDLAFATGRGEPLMTDWPGTPAPLVPDNAVVQLGEREGRDADFSWPDIRETDINRIEIFEALTLAPADLLTRVRAPLERLGWPFWVHFDVDVLDQSVMPAVDSPGSPGIAPVVLVPVLRDLILDPRCCGWTVTIFDPDLDPTGALARLLVSLLSEVLDPAPMASR